ncbi:MAG: hypothetical protein LC776_16860, partial [Acidobacteria bacterium]|nr:hypothetical protein [Acidobacteriota bacterium]
MEGEGSINRRTHRYRELSRFKGFSIELVGVGVVRQCKNLGINLNIPYHGLALLTSICFSIT